MKKPWFIGTLSVIPGLGLIVLGEFAWGLGVALLTAFLVFLGLVVHDDIIPATSFTLAIIAWVTQLYYAVLTAQRWARIEANQAAPIRQTPIEHLPPGASLGERRLYSARQSLVKLLQPGECLETAVFGSIGMPSLASALFQLVMALLGSPPSGPAVRQVYLGATRQDFLLADTDRFGEAVNLRRSPLCQVRLLEYREGLFSDQLIIDRVEVRPLRVSVGRAARLGTQQMVGLLPAANIQAEMPGDGKERVVARPQAYAAPVKIVQNQEGVSASTYLLTAGTSLLFMLAGYAVGHVFLSPILIADSQEVSDLIGDIGVLLICCLPVIIPAALLGALPVVRIQRRFHLSPWAALAINGVISAIIGGVAYLPYTFLLLIAAAF